MICKRDLHFKEIYDISIPLGAAPNYPGDKPFSHNWMSKLENGADYSLSALGLSSHAGTHLDAPAHILKEGITLDKYPMSRFIIPATVVSFAGGDEIPASALQDLDIEKGEALLFQTENSRRFILHNPDFLENFVYLSDDAAKQCVLSGAGLVGIDSLSVDKYDDPLLPAHHALLENDVLVLEGIDLSGIPRGRYTLICFPLRIEGAEASPARAMLVR